MEYFAMSCGVLYFLKRKKIINPDIRRFKFIGKKIKIN